MLAQPGLRGLEPAVERPAPQVQPLESELAALREALLQGQLHGHRAYLQLLQVAHVPDQHHHRGEALERAVAGVPEGQLLIRYEQRAQAEAAVAIRVLHRVHEAERIRARERGERLAQHQQREVRLALRREERKPPRPKEKVPPKERSPGGAPPAQRDPRAP